MVNFIDNVKKRFGKQTPPVPGNVNRLNDNLFEKDLSDLDKQLHDIDNQLVHHKEKVNQYLDKKVSLLDTKFNGKHKWEQLLKIKESIELLDKDPDIPYTSKYQIIVREITNILKQLEDDGRYN